MSYIVSFIQPVINPKSPQYGRFTAAYYNSFTQEYVVDSFKGEWEAVAWLNNKAPGHKRVLTYDFFQPFIGR